MSQQRKTRLLLYCHNAVGLGHIIRASQVAAALANKSNCECAIITGCSFLGRIPIDSRVQIEELPPVRLTRGARFTSVDNQDDGGVMDLRARRIEDFTQAYSPDVFLTDHAPLGLGGELVPTLTAARRQHWPTRFIWALRDIQVAPQHAARMARPPANPTLRAALEAYSGAIGYSDKDWIDPFEPYEKWFLPQRRDYVGVIAQRALPRLQSVSPTAVILSGGGTGGAQLFRLVLQAALPLFESTDVKLRFVVGPFGSKDKLDVPGQLRDRVELLSEASTQETIRDGSLIISRAGYNTAYTVIQTPLPLIFVPFAFPGDEQIYRARMMARLPNVAVIEEDWPNAVLQLRAAMQHGLGSVNVARELPFRTDGAERTADLLMTIGVRHEVEN